eukprot:g3885.t1
MLRIVHCCHMEIDSESLFTRFGKNAETIRVTGKLKNLKGKVGVVTIRNLEESWIVKIPKGFLLGDSGKVIQIY